MGFDQRCGQVKFCMYCYNYAYLFNLHIHVHVHYGKLLIIKRKVPMIQVYAQQYLRTTNINFTKKSCLEKLLITQLLTFII